jgi:aminomethyltransferase
MSEQATKRTPLFEQHKAAGGKLVPFAGYQLPIQYEGIVREHQAVRTAAGLFDVSHMGELRVSGHGAVAFVDYVVTGDLRSVAVGQAMYCCACNERGGILDDLIVYKHADDDILIVCNASNHEKILAHLTRLAPQFSGVTIEDESDRTALLALQGPRALQILERADAGLSDLSRTLRSFRFVTEAVCGAKATIARTGYTGEDGVEIFCAAEDAAAIWKKLLAAGKSSGLLPAGLGARDTLRLEARLSLYGNELDEQTTPLEAGLAWVVKLHKPNFMGKAALQTQADQGVERRIAGVVVTGRGVARKGYPVKTADGRRVGAVTSGCPSPSLGKPIALCMLEAGKSELGTQLLVDCRGKDIPAEVVKLPFYRRK